MTVCPSVSLFFRLWAVRLSVRTEQLRSHLKDYNEILYSNIFQKCVKKIQVSLKSDRITGIVHEDQCKFLIISRSVLLRIKRFQTNIAEKIKTQFYIQYFFFFENRDVYEIM
jgi:hypothetical protein